MAVSTTVDAKIIGRWVDRLTRPSKKDFAKFERVAQKALKRIAIGAAAAGAALVKLTTSTLDQVSALNDVAERTDFTVERLQTLRFAFGQVGATATETDQSLRRFTRRLGLAAQ
ncbi:MAG: hypothetical protein GWO11_01695, partial [Desulfuromonadales bacterium]|nr:hypothetical protein [Desulfuromonadales bacterium]NIS85518.1 hypothetical protein [Nitrospinaceae bacterium]NIU96722.1 hypothetical protein [Nitrospinaceae bacterium]